MAIKINLQASEANLFCSSKWWGDPDMPFDMEYPTVEVTDEDGTYDYPLTFVCQIDCEDIAPLDPENRLPHTGMFYIFAGLDEYLDQFDSPFHNGKGPWPKKMVVSSTPGPSILRPSAAPSSPTRRTSLFLSPPLR